MLNLMKLEAKKINKGNLLLTFLAVNAGIIGLFLLFRIDQDAAELLMSYESVFTTMETLIVASFVIYASVLLSHLVVEEFRDKTITVLFMYPVSRKKLLLAKVLIVSILTFVFILFSNIIVFGGFTFLNSIFHYISEPFTLEMFTERGLRVLLSALSSAGIALIPLFFGMRKYSVPATIVSSILIITLLSSPMNNTDTLYSLAAVPITLGLAGFLTAYLVIARAVKTDF